MLDDTIKCDAYFHWAQPLTKLFEDKSFLDSVK